MTVPIFASLTWGFDPHVWGALSFRAKGSLESLKKKCAAGGYALLIGARGPRVREDMRGRLLALARFEPVLTPTRSLVEPSWYEDQVRQDGGEKWPYAFPITAAEEFDPRPDRSAVLPRFDEDNLHMSLATHFQELKDDEAARVLALPRRPVRTIYRPS